ncbi:hypothetical protein BJ170DRAFT_417781 [Xylariales sp. AK1849]|nr:hypothetical protein BJ170DRAFT_417781 [Xylariales sp. AK1849]
MSHQDLTLWTPEPPEIITRDSSRRRFAHKPLSNTSRLEPTMAKVNEARDGDLASSRHRLLPAAGSGRDQGKGILDNKVMKLEKSYIAKDVVGYPANHWLHLSATQRLYSVQRAHGHHMTQTVMHGSKSARRSSNISLEDEYHVTQVGLSPCYMDSIYTGSTQKQTLTRRGSMRNPLSDMIVIEESKLHSFEFDRLSRGSSRRTPITTEGGTSPPEKPHGGTVPKVRVNRKNAPRKKQHSPVPPRAPQIPRLSTPDLDPFVASPVSFCVCPCCVEDDDQDNDEKRCWIANRGKMDQQN